MDPPRLVKKISHCVGRSQKKTPESCDFVQTQQQDKGSDLARSDDPGSKEGHEPCLLLSVTYLPRNP
ncbi:hypothetical protein DY000_02058959 [Brassica cretica]|uniref:Uncharacterized protein n=1 Tax=Brassica cretica TaxID=69181 RepID=A0ABQ7B2Y4_BRACR|nr:hypothetical protein DY000_02058959 [Brassica cretica]